MEFLIKRGSHYSNNFIYKLFNFFHFRKSTTYVVRFDNSCIYTLPKEDQSDINKLFGFSLGLHHKNSARFGWCWVDNKIQLWGYWYDNGVRKFEYIQSIEIGVSYYLTIKNLETKWEFTVYDCDRLTTRKIEFDKSKSSIDFGYTLWPYFGGNRVAPQDITIQMIDFND